ncbi:DUF4401 domain-containing protein [uncultured Cohaesibacter sp.]|uniref:DUF4401 domain-containing protein n=1 Tax=uncultured Cohaesibacter sp. TaxID=1002546 RepID=UPI0029C86AA3|nr:DUF4401 domain-containing protein [uncultured Cohaesibacter sp.]
MSDTTNNTSATSLSVTASESYRLIKDAPRVPAWLDFARRTDGLTPRDESAIRDEILAIKDRETTESPLYLRALSGIGAIVSGLLLLYLLYLFGLFKLGDINLIINGLVLMVVSTLLYRSGMGKTGIGQDYLVQTALTLLQAGKVSLITGLAQMIDTLFDLSWAWPMAAILGIVAILSFLLFPSSIERFVSAITFLLSLWICLLIDGPENGRAFAFTVLVAAHLIALASFLVFPGVRRVLTSFFDALIVSLCVGVGIISTFIKMQGLGKVDLDVVDMSVDLGGIAQKWPLQILLTLALLALVVWVAGRHRAKPTEPMLVAFAGICLLGLVADPAIVLALGLMIVGYATHRPVHSMLGLLFAIGFGCHYYYILEMTLLQKSAVLVLSGLVFLFGAAVIYWRGWHETLDDADGGDIMTGRDHNA